MRAIRCAQLLHERRGVTADLPAAVTADGLARTRAVMALLIVSTSIVQQELHNRLRPVVAYDPAYGSPLAAPQRARALLGARATTPARGRGAARRIRRRHDGS